MEVNIMAKHPNKEVRKALDTMKMEISKELNIQLTNAGKVGGTMTKRLVEMGEKEIMKDYNK